MDWRDLYFNPQEFIIDDDINLFLLCLNLFVSLHPLSNFKKYGFFYVKVKNDFDYDISQISSRTVSGPAKTFWGPEVLEFSFENYSKDQ
jgi:hypothetical protein